MWRFLKNLGIELTYNPAIPLLGIQTEETRIERDTCTPRFIAVLFTIAGAWKQGRWMDKEVCGIYTQWNTAQLYKGMHLS